MMYPTQEEVEAMAAECAVDDRNYESFARRIIDWHNAKLMEQCKPVGFYYWENVADATFLALPSATTPHQGKDDFPLYTRPMPAMKEGE